MEPSDIVLLVLGVLCPPGSVALKRGLNRDFIICVGLTLLFWIPGIAYSWYLIFRYPLENFRRRGANTARYQTIEDGLRRQSMGSGLVSDDDVPPSYPSAEEDESRTNTMTSESSLATAHSTRLSMSATPSSKKSGSGRSKKSHRRQKSHNSVGGGSSRGRRSSSSLALQEAARNYAKRQHQRKRSSSIKNWFVDRFYFPDPTQVPPSLDNPRNESHELGNPR